MNNAERAARQADLRRAAEEADAARDRDQRAQEGLNNRCCGTDSQGRRCTKTGNQVHECTTWRVETNDPCRCWSCRECGWAFRAAREDWLHLQEMMACACCLAESAEATDEDPELDLYLREISERLGGLPPDLQRMLDNGFRGSRQGLCPPGQ